VLVDTVGLLDVVAANVGTGGGGGGGSAAQPPSSTTNAAATPAAGVRLDAAGTDRAVITADTVARGALGRR